MRSLLLVLGLCWGTPLYIKTERPGCAAQQDCSHVPANQYWHCSTCRVNATNPTDCLSCLPGWVLDGGRFADCTGECVSLHSERRQKVVLQDVIDKIQSGKARFSSVEAITLAAAFGSSLVWRLLTHTAIRNTQFAKGKRTVAFLLTISQWWVIMLFIFSWHTFGQLRTAYKVYWIHYEGLTNTSEFQVAHDPVMPDLLRGVSFGSFVALMLCFLVVSIHVACHAVEGWKHTMRYGNTSRARDVAIQVLMMPLVYGLMAGRDIERLWSALTGTFDTHLDHATPYFWDKFQADHSLVDANNGFAEFYEAWALLQFGRLATRLLKPQLKQAMRGMEPAPKPVVKGKGHGHGGTPLINLVDVSEQMLLLGVQFFVVATTAAALLAMVKVWLFVSFSYNVCDDFASICTADSAIKGAVLGLSGVAVLNLLVFNHSMADALGYEGFGAPLKFWGIKLLVMVANWQAILVRPIFSSTLNEDQLLLLIASLKVYEVTMLALWNLGAWSIKEPFYGNLENQSAVSMIEKTTQFQKKDDAVGAFAGKGGDLERPLLPENGRQGTGSGPSKTAEEYMQEMARLANEWERSQGRSSTRSHLAPAMVLD